MKRSQAQALKRQKTIIVRQETEEKPSLLKRVLRAITRVFAIIGLLLVLSIVSGIVIGLMSGGQPSLPSSFVLTHHFQGAPEQSESLEGFLSDPFAPPQPTLNDLVFRIRAAATDERVKAIAVRISDGDYPLSMIEELHAAMTVFHESGKPSLAYADHFGMLSNGTGEYLLAAAFDDIWLAPEGGVSTTGFALNIPYYKAAMDRFGVRAEMTARKDYKTGPNAMLRNRMSAQQKEMLNDVLDNNMQVASRLLNDADIIRLFDNAPYNAQQAVDNGLVDKIVPYWALDTHFEGDESISLASYSAKKGKVDSKNRVALIKIEGVILDIGGLQANPFGLLGQNIASPQDISQWLIEAAKDDDITAVIMQVNSPGGSPQGAELIRQAALQVKAAGKPLYAAMGAQAASGGYWVAADADRIWALPSTVTGSIGVYGGKYDLSRFWKEWGVTWETVSRGKNAAMWTMHTPYDATSRQALNDEMDRIYNRFTALVAAARGMSDEEIESIAQGRIWTGTQAVENGLIDALGGIQDVVDYTKEHLGIADTHKVQVQTFPAPRAAYERFMDTLPMGSRQLSVPPAFHDMAAQALTAPYSRAVMALPLPLVY